MRFWRDLSERERLQVAHTDPRQCSLFPASEESESDNPGGQETRRIDRQEKERKPS